MMEDTTNRSMIVQKAFYHLGCRMMEDMTNRSMIVQKAKVFSLGK